MFKSSVVKITTRPRACQSRSAIKTMSALLADIVLNTKTQKHKNTLHSLDYLMFLFIVLLLILGLVQDILFGLSDTETYYKRRQCV